jgi:hypothetical protein
LLDDPGYPFQAFSPCPQNLQLHKLGIAAIQGPLEDAFSQLKRCYIPICGITKHDLLHTDVERELQQSQAVFAAPCSTSATQELSLQLSETTPKEREALVTIDVRLMSAAIESQQFTRLRRIELCSSLICDILPDISQLV